MMVAMLSVGFTACGYDDDDEGESVNANDSRIVGTWHSVISESWDYEDGVLVEHWKDMSATSTRIFEMVNGVESGKYRDGSHSPEWEEYTFASDGNYRLKNEDGDVLCGIYNAFNGNLRITDGDNSDTYKSRTDTLFQKGALLRCSLL